VPSGYESPRATTQGDVFRRLRPNNQASARRRRRSATSTAPLGVGMQSPDEAATKGGLSEDHRRTLTSSIVLTREGSLTKRIERVFG
jgi:hypothetical protein